MSKLKTLTVLASMIS